jgi:plastocyanin
MRKLIALLAVAAVIGAVLAVQAFASTTTVSWKVPTNKTVKIHRGSTVKWVWADGAPHNVKGPGFSSGAATTRPHSYKHTFRKSGTFKIICQVHPTTMKTIVKVS